MLILISFCLEGFSQEEKFKFPFNKAVVSINKTPTRRYKKCYYRFGLGMNRSFRDSNKIGFVMGIHYNRTSQYVDDNYYYAIHGMSYESEVTYIFNTITVPFS